MAQVSVRVGAARSEGGVPAANGPQIAPRYDWARGQARGFVELGVTHLGGLTAWQLSAREAESRSRRGWTWGSDVTLSANLLSGGNTSGRGALGAAIGRAVGPVVLGVGSGIGVLRNTAGTFRATLDYRFLATAGQDNLGAQLRYQGTSILGASAGYRDLEFGLSHRMGIVSISTSNGWRWFEGLPRQGMNQTQLRVQPAAWLAFDLAAGKSPTSLEGYGKGTWYTGGVRLTHARRVRGPVIERTPSGARVAFAVSGREAAIAGEWNNWTPVPMAKDASGRWSAELTLGAGAHKFVLIVDGKNVVPRGSPKLPDGFGGEVGLLVI